MTEERNTDAPMMAMLAEFSVRPKRGLLAGFEPGETDVMCGKGRECFNHSGNQTFRGIIDMNLERYSEADTKVQKSGIVDGIVAIVRQRSPNGGFIRREKDGSWCEIGDHHAREKVGHSFREALLRRNPEKREKRRRQRARNKARRNGKGTDGKAEDKPADSTKNTEETSDATDVTLQGTASESPVSVAAEPTSEPMTEREPDSTMSEPLPAPVFGQQFSLSAPLPPSLEPVPLDRAPSMHLLMRAGEDAQTAQVVQAAAAALPTDLLRMVSSTFAPIPLTSMKSSTSRDWFNATDVAAALSDQQKGLLADVDLSEVEDFFEISNRQQQQQQQQQQQAAAFGNPAACVA